jgi:KDEL-tailed cysteine endopeptidase
MYKHLFLLSLLVIAAYCQYSDYEDYDVYPDYQEPQYTIEQLDKILDLRNYRNTQEWYNTYRIRYQKQNENSWERYSVFQKNVQELMYHNYNSEKKYQVGLTQFTDQTLEELAEKYLDFDMGKKVGLGRFLKEKPRSLQSQDEEENKNYSPIDYRDSDIFLPVRDQKECGGCWAFASAGAMEGLRAQSLGVKKYLSVQQLIDCDTKEKGCKGGWPSIAYSYIKSNGIVSDEDYPFAGSNQSCDSQTVKSRTEGKISGINSCEEEECMSNDFQYNLLKNGPMAIVIDAYHTNFFNYKSGYYDEECSEPNHAIVLIGYGYDAKENIQYWIIRNSWGDSWGMNGYGYVKFDLNNYLSCNINRYGFQPKVIS